MFPIGWERACRSGESTDSESNGRSTLLSEFDASAVARGGVKENFHIPEAAIGTKKVIVCRRFAALNLISRRTSTLPRKARFQRRHPEWQETCKLLRLRMGAVKMVRLSKRLDPLRRSADCRDLIGALVFDLPVNNANGPRAIFVTLQNAALPVNAGCRVLTIYRDGYLSGDSESLLRGPPIAGTYKTAGSFSARDSLTIFRT